MATVTISTEEIAGISRVLRELGLPVSVYSLLLSHAQAVTESADRLGLVSGADVAHVLTRHTGDSLLFAVARVPLPGESWIDVGSGAGFPGMVLACCYPDTTFVLAEPQQRRAGFLDLCITNLGLLNVTVTQARAADIDARFDVATARALAEPVLAIEAMRKLLFSHGSALLAVGETAAPPAGIEDLDCHRDGIQSPGRIFRLDLAAGGA